MRQMAALAERGEIAPMVVAGDDGRDGRWREPPVGERRDRAANLRLKSRRVCTAQGNVRQGQSPDYRAALKATSGGMVHHDELQQMANLDQEAGIFDDHALLNRP